MRQSSIGQASRRRARSVSVLLAVGLIAPGCSSPTSEVSLVEALRSRHQVADAAAPYRDVAELLGNTTYRIGSLSPVARTEAVVRGRVTDVGEGRAFEAEGEDSPGGTRIQFDDPQAQWRTFHAVVEVAEVISGSAADTITVGLALGPDLEVETVRRDLVGLGELVLFLDRSPVFAYDVGVHGTVGDGAFLATLDSQGRMGLPVLTVEESAQLLAGVETIDDLRAAARDPAVVIRLDATGTERVGQG